MSPIWQIVPTERTLARICREAGATVRCNVKLRDMNVRVHATDERSIEVLASGLAMNHGAQLAVDITLRSAVTACGRACPNAATVDGAVLTRARRDKETKYVELLEGDRCQLVVVGVSRLAEEVVPHAFRVLQSGILWVVGFDDRRSVDRHRRRRP